MNMAAAPALPIVFINLDRDEDRRQRLQAELATLPWPSRRLHAVWWADVPPAEQSALYSEALNAGQFFQPLVNGEKGCYASHIAAWRQLVASDAPAMVVLEDDVRLEGGFQTVIEAIARLDRPWDMVKLIGREQEKLRSSQPLGADHRLVQYTRVPSLTAGYVVSRTGAHKLLQHRVPFGRPIDVDLRFWWECDLQVFGIWPPAIALDETSFTSAIGPRPLNRSWGRSWRKLMMKTRLTVLNALHRGRQPRL